MMELTLATHPQHTSRRIDPLVPLYIDTPKYVLKTADALHELSEVLSLRAQIFSGEYGVELNESVFDVDPFDFKCDHLIILEKASGRIIGTYRLLCSLFTDRFYTQTEFRIDQFLANSEVKLELGRACIHKEHRKGAVLNLLWRGVTTYAKVTEATTLFGCSSVKTESFAEAKAVSEKLLSRGAVLADSEILPIGPFRIPEYSEIRATHTEVPIPSLLTSYLNAGAKVAFEPAYDAAFHCMDYFTALDLREITEAYDRKYNR